MVGFSDRRGTMRRRERERSRWEDQDRDDIVRQASRSGRDPEFIGVVVDVEGQAFSDARYNVASAYRGTDGRYYPLETTDQGYRRVIATNLLERYGDGREPTHRVLTGTAVVVREAAGRDGARVFYFAGLSPTIEYFTGGTYCASDTKSISGCTTFGYGQFEDRYQDAGLQKGGIGYCESFAWFDADDGEGPRLYAGGLFNWKAGDGRATASLLRWDGDIYGLSGQWEVILETSTEMRHVYALEVHDDGNGKQLYAGGEGPTGVNDWVYRSSDGDTWSAVTGGIKPNSTVFALRSWRGKLFAGGAFGGFVSGGSVAITEYSGGGWNNVDGWGLGGEFTGGVVYDFEIHNDGSAGGIGPENEKLYAVGAFSEINGVPVSDDGNVARYDLSSLEIVGKGIPVDGGDAVYAISWYIDNGEKILIAGGSEDADGEPLLAWDGGVWSPAGDDLIQQNKTGVVCRSLARIGDSLAVGGLFHRRRSEIGLAELGYVASYSSSGASYSGIGDGFNGPVYALADFDSTILAGGLFTRSGDSEAERIAKLVSGAWVGGSEFSAKVRGIADLDGIAIAVGAFIFVDGAAAPYIAKSTDGLTWEGFTTFNDQTYAVEVVGDRAYVGGKHTVGGGVFGPALHSWEGSGAWVPELTELTYGGEPGTIYCLAVDGDDLWIGGLFDTINGLAAKNVAVLNTTTGTVTVPDSGMTGPDGPVYGIARLAGSTYVGGAFGSLSPGFGVDNFARWNGSAWSSPTGAIVSKPVHAVGVVGSVVWFDHFGSVGTGSFGRPGYGVTSYNGTSYSRIGGADGQLNGPVRAILDNGDGKIGGDFTGAGEPIDSPQIAEMVLALYRNGKWVHAQGGCGWHPVAEEILGLGSGSIAVIHPFRYAGDSCDRILVGGSAANIRSRIYAEGVSAVRTAGARPIGGINGGLRWYDSANWTSGIRGALRRADGTIALVGSWEYGHNADLGRETPADVVPVVGCKGVMRTDGRFFYPYGTGISRVAGKAITEYGGVLIAAGDNPPESYDESTETWSSLGGSVFNDPDTYNHLLVTPDDVVGLVGAFATLAAPGTPLVYAEWNGGSWSPDTISELTTGFMGIAFEDILYVAGETAFPGSGWYSLHQKAKGGGWQRFQSSKQVSGPILSVALANDPVFGKLLVAVGGIDIDFTGSVESGNFAVYEFRYDRWTIISIGGLLGVARWVWSDPRRPGEFILAGGSLADLENLAAAGFVRWSMGAGFSVEEPAGSNSEPLYVGWLPDGTGA